MHYLFGIVAEAADKEDAKNQAQNILDDYLTNIYDWYADGAGRWSQEFEDNVIPATDSRFDETVERLLRYQKSEYEECRKMIKDFDFYDKLYYTGESEQLSDGTYYLEKWANYVSGAPMTSSYIFDISHCTSRITSKQRERYMQRPEEYYLVLFDIHN